MQSLKQEYATLQAENKKRYPEYKQAPGIYRGIACRYLSRRAGVYGYLSQGGDCCGPVRPGVGRVGAEGAGAPAACQERPAPITEKRLGAVASVAGRETVAVAALQEGC